MPPTPSMPWISPVATSLPPTRLTQEQLREAAAALLGEDSPALDVFANSQIEARALAMPIEWYAEPHGFKERSRAYREAGLALAEEAARLAIAEAGLRAGDVGATVMVSTTGIATPSLEARLANRLGLPNGMARVPVWGLGCAGGVAGIARAAELARARGQPVLLVALELCSLSFDISRLTGASGEAEAGLKSLPSGTGSAQQVLQARPAPPDKKALVAAALFGDGCAALVVHPDTSPVPSGGAELLATTSHLFPDSERVMGWDIEDHNLDVVLSPRIPDIVRHGMNAVVAPFLQANLGGRPDEWLLHPGGAKVVQAYRDALDLDGHDLRHTKHVLRAHGNMSSPTALFVLQRAQRTGFLGPGRTGLLAALGPGFACELALVRGA